MDVRRVTNVNTVALINLVNRIFKDYKLPVQWTLLGFQLDARENSISFSDSFVFYENDQPVGFVLIAKRKERARIDAMGVIPEKRGTGLAHYMLDYAFEQLRWKGVRKVTLEVLEEDVRAVRFYKKYGFRESRYLITMVLPSSKKLSTQQEYKITRADPRWIHEKAIQAMFGFSRTPNWQREPVTLLLANGRYNMCKVEDYGYLVWGTSEGGAFIVDCAPFKTSHTFEEVLEKSMSYMRKEIPDADITAANLPEDDPLYKAAEKMGFITLFKQYEMFYNIH